MSDPPADPPAPPADPPPADPPPDPSPAPDPPPPSQIFSDPATGTLAPDFANQLGMDVQPYAATLNQRFGGQSIEKLAKSYGEANKTISEGGRPIPYPPADASEEEWQKWAQTNSVPEKAEDYQLFEEPPENISEEALGMFKEVFHEAKAPPALAQRIASKYVEIEKEMARRYQDAHQNRLHEAQQQLQKELGPEYEDRINKVKAVVASHGYDPGDAELFDNPKVVGFMAKMVNLLGEDTVASMKDAAMRSGQFRGDGKSEAQRIMTDTSHPDHNRYRQGDPEVAAKVARLLQGGHG